MRIPSQSLALLTLALAVPAAADDLTIVSKVTQSGKAPTTTTSYLSSDHARIDTGDGHEMIADLKNGDVTIIDGQKRQYFVVTRQDMDQLQARMQKQMNSPEMQRAQEQMKNLPPEIKKKMQAMMGGLVSAVTVEKTGPARKIAGYNCETWTIAVGEISKTVECLTTELPLPAQAWQAYQDMANRTKSMTAAMGPMAKSMSDLQEKMKDVKGFPMSSTTTASVLGHSTATTTEVVEVKRGTVPASAWQLPAGYTKIDNPMAKAARSM
jgi:hypothetical protein